MYIICNSICYTVNINNMYKHLHIKEYINDFMYIKYFQ